MPGCSDSASMSHPEPLARLIEQLQRLPGIGAKSAQRLAYHILRTPREAADQLCAAVQDVKERVTYCSTCNNITDVDPCAFCTDDRRERHLICVVEEPQNVAAIEKTREFRGIYHVLMGALSPLQGVGPDDLKIRGLLTRVGEGGVNEVVLATNPNVEGEATALYLARLLKPLGVRVTRIATGIPSAATSSTPTRSRCRRRWKAGARSKDAQAKAWAYVRSETRVPDTIRARRRQSRSETRVGPSFSLGNTTHVPSHTADPRRGPPAPRRAGRLLCRLPAVPHRPRASTGSCSARCWPRRWSAPGTPDRCCWPRWSAALIGAIVLNFAYFLRRRAGRRGVRRDGGDDAVGPRRRRAARADRDPLRRGRRGRRDVAAALRDHRRHRIRRRVDARSSAAWRCWAIVPRRPRRRPTTCGSCIRWIPRQASGGCCGSGWALASPAP